MKEETLTGTILDEHLEVTIEELTNICFCETEWVIELVSEGILEPMGTNREQWRFTGVCVLRARTARRLQKDLGINLAGVALALELMEQIEGLQARVNRLL
jgi:chaperone modulatory protein CbpM